MTSLDELYGSGIGVADPNSNFYTWDKRSFPDFNTFPENHTKYNYQPKELNNNGNPLYAQRFSYTNGVDKPCVTPFDVCQGKADNSALYIIKNLQLDKVGIKFFSKKNILTVQNMIKHKIYEMTNKKVIMAENQDDSDLVIAMRKIYLEEGRYLPTNIDFQVKRLNMRLLNYIIPDMITAIKQDYGYQKDINEPVQPIDRPISDSIRGQKLLPSITTTWDTQLKKKI